MAPAAAPALGRSALALVPGAVARRSRAGTPGPQFLKRTRASHSPHRRGGGTTRQAENLCDLTGFRGAPSAISSLIAICVVGRRPRFPLELDRWVCVSEDHPLGERHWQHVVAAMLGDFLPRCSHSS